MTLGDSVTLPEQVDDLLLGGGNHARIFGLYIDAAQIGLARDALHCARIGNDEHIVLIAALD